MFIVLGTAHLLCLGIVYYVLQLLKVLKVTTIVINPHRNVIPSVCLLLVPPTMFVLIQRSTLF